MNDEIMRIRSWAQDALKRAVNKRNEKHKVSEYDRGRIAGIISAYQHIMVETSHTAAWKISYNTFEGEISDIIVNTLHTLSDAIGIYYFCESNDMLSMDNTIETIIVLGNAGFDSYQIKSMLARKLIRKGTRLNRAMPGGRKRDE